MPFFPEGIDGCPMQVPEAREGEDSGPSSPLRNAPGSPLGFEGEDRDTGEGSASPQPTARLKVVAPGRARGIEHTPLGVKARVGTRPRGESAVLQRNSFP